MGLTFETVDATLKCDHPNFSFAFCFFVVMLILLHKVVLSFESLNEILKCDNLKLTTFALWFSVVR